MTHHLKTGKTCMMKTLILIGKYVTHCTINHISKSWNIMERSKRPSKYHLSIKFFTEKKTVFPITKKFKTWTFQKSINTIFPSTFWLKKRPYFPSRKSSKQELFSNQSISYFHQLFGSKNDRIFHFQKFQNNNFSLISKHGIPC